jgi:hypothetical protein
VALRGVGKAGPRNRPLFTVSARQANHRRWPSSAPLSFNTAVQFATIVMDAEFASGTESMRNFFSIRLQTERTGHRLNGNMGREKWRNRAFYGVGLWNLSTIGGRTSFESGPRRVPTRM